MLNLENLIKLKKNDLLNIIKDFDLKNIKNKNKKDLIQIILNKDGELKDKYNPVKINETIYNKIYHISDIHIRPLVRHTEYNEVFENLYLFLEKDISNNNIIAVTGDIIHEKDLLKPETIIICRNFVKKLSKYGTVIIITGNHDMLENNPDRLDNLTALFDDLPVHYIVKSGAYLFGNVIFTVSSLVDKKFIKKNQVININKLPIVCLYHGTINGCLNDFGYIIETKTQHSTRFRKISDFDGYDMVLMGDVHKHQYLKPHIAYSGSLIQQNFGENIKEHGVLIWDILSKKSNFVPISNIYGFITIKVINNNWAIPTDIPYKPYIRLLVTDTNNDQLEIIKNELIEKYEIQSFKIIQITDNEKMEELPIEVTIHQDDIDIIKEEMEVQNISEEKKTSILELHNKLKLLYSDNNNFDYTMNNQSWKILKLSFKNVFIFGENKMNIIDFTNLNGITTIVGPNAIGKSNIINIIIFILYGNNINFKVPHILNKYQNEYFIECELLFGAQHFKIQKIGKKRKYDKLDHSFSFYIYEENKWIKQDKENNKGTSNLIKSFLGNVEQFLLTNVYSNSSLRTILTLTNSEKHKALNKLFCLDIYENLEKLAKNEISEIKKKISYLEGEKKGLLYNFKKNEIEIIQEQLNNFGIKLLIDEKEHENVNKKIDIYEGEKKIILNRKYNLLLSIKHIEYKNYDIIDIKNQIQTYYIKYKDIISKKVNDINNLENLRFEYYSLKSSLKLFENNYVNFNIKDYKDITELLLEEKIICNKIKKYENKIIKLKNNQEKNQSIINNYYQKIVSLPEIIIDLNKINILDKKYNNICSIFYLENELINLKSKIINIKKFDNKTLSFLIVNLPKDYDNNHNDEKLKKINNKIYIYSEKAKKYLKLLNDNNFNKISENIIDYTITNNIRKSNYNINIKNLKEQIKQFDNLNLLYFSDNMINKEIDTLINNENIIKTEKLEKYIEILSIDDLLSTNNKLEIKNFLELIKYNIDNSTFFISNNKLLELIKYKKIKKQIKEIQYNYYNECYQYINYILKCLNTDNELHDNYKYTYYIDIQNKCLEIEEKIKNEKIKNDNLINKCNEYKIELENIKKNISIYTNKLSNLKDKLHQITIIIKNITIYNNNNEINNKLNIINNNILEQNIRNKYGELLMLLKDIEIYNKITHDNVNIQIDIDKHTEMLEKIELNISIENDIYNSIKSNILSIIKDISVQQNKLNELKDIKKKEEDINDILNIHNKDLLSYSDYVKIVNKNNIPIKLILKKTKYIQDHINIFLEKLTSFTIKIDVSCKNGIDFNVHKNNLILDVNQLSGYETFILNIALKSALNKYSFISKSTLFILDEGLDVVDKDNFLKLNILMKLLMKHYKHILLISHMPKVKDLQNYEVNIQNNGLSSYISYI